MLRQVDVVALRGTFAAMNWALLAVSVLQMLIVLVLGVASWFWPPCGRRPDLAAHRLFWIGLLFSQVLPSSAGGDVVRIFMMRRSGTNLRVAFNSVALERASMLITLIAFVALLMPFLASRVVVAQLAWIAPSIVAGGR